MEWLFSIQDVLTSSLSSLVLEYRDCIPTPSLKTSIVIYEKFQNIDKHIQFKIERSDNTESLSLLDFKIQISPTGKIYTCFYRKPTTTNLLVHFKSALLLSAKTNYIRNKIKRIHNRCSEEKDKITHTGQFINILRNNDYKTSITRCLDNKKSRKLHRPFNTCFLKLPHFSEIITKEIRRAIYKEGLKIHLDYFGPLLRQYQTKKNDNTITTCTLANSPIRDPKICQKTYTIYRLICLK